MSILVSSHNAFLPIIRKLGKDVVTLDPDFSKMLADLDLPAKNISELVQADVLRAKAIQYSIKIIKKGLPPNGLDKSADNFIRNDLPTLMYTRLPDLGTLVLALDEVKPELVLLHNDVEPLLRTVALWAKANDVPCIHIPHAIYQDVNRTKPGTDIHDLVTASNIAVGGPFQRQWYELRGVEPDKIRETGLPQFDPWANVKLDKERAKRILKLDSCPVVCYMGTWRQNTNILGNSDEWVQLYFEFLKAMTELTDYQTIIKVHPRASQENVKFHGDNANQAGLNAILTPHHLESCLQASDVVFAPYASNTLLEASFIPGLKMLTTHGYVDDPEVTKVGMTKDAIKDAITNAPRYDGSLIRFQTKYIGLPDGKASDRIVQWINEL